MDYYHCSIQELHQELQRRNYDPFGTRDQLSEWLQADDDMRGSEATTIITDIPKVHAPCEVNLMRAAEFGQAVLAAQLVDQRIVYWGLNTFFPTLQLFFESGLSCTIDSDQLPGVTIGLDPKLRFRLTDSIHEEEGRVIRGTLPKKFVCSGASIRILEAMVVRRTSIATKSTVCPDQLHTLKAKDAAIVREVHTVIGLRLSGMKEMGYVWAKTELPSRKAGGRIWRDVRLAGLRADVPAPFLGLPAVLPESGGQLTVVEKRSMIKRPTGTPDHLDEQGRPWIRGASDGSKYRRLVISGKICSE